jgi:hypothetical protein
MHPFEARALSAVAAALALLAATGAHADRAAVPLEEMVVRSSHIVLGTVTDVTPGTTPGATSMRVAVEEILAGPELTGFALQHSPRDPSGPPPLDRGARVLVFLQGSAPVGGEQGVVALSDANSRFARELAMRAVTAKGALTLAGVHDLLLLSDAPPALLGSLLADLSRRATREDEARLTELACGATSSPLLPAVQNWAIGRAGALRLRGARPCLEGFVRDSKQSERAIAAADALGDLGDPESLPLLRSVLDAVKGEPIPPTRGDTAQPSITAPANDPEDESDATPDRYEGGSRPPVLGPRVLPTPSPTPAGHVVPDGEVEADGAPAEGSSSADTLSVAAILAVGKLGDEAAVSSLLRLAQTAHPFEVHSTVVHSLGLIGGASATEALDSISRTHPDAMIRVQARETLARLLGSTGGVR